MKKAIIFLSLLSIILLSILYLYSSPNSTPDTSYCEHQFDNGYISLPSTCNQEGILIKTCILCNTKENFALSKTTHDYVSNITKEATCSNDGLLTMSCNICHSTQESIIPATKQHDFVQTTIFEATCYEVGLIKEYCIHCNAEGNSINLDLLSHNYILSDSQPATCLNNGNETYTCSHCNDSYSQLIKAHGHTWSQWITTKEPTYDTQGTRIRNCTICNINISETIPVRILTNAEKKQLAYAVAQKIADSITSENDTTRIGQAAGIVASYCAKATYTTEGYDYSQAYGVFIKGEYSCAGATRALGMVLECMGYEWKHINENQWNHQWCEVIINGETCWADGQMGLIGSGKHPAANY